MKILILMLSLTIASYSSYAQNTFPYTGNVGIGTNNPAGTLHVSSANSTNLILESTINSQAYMQFNANGNPSYFGLSANSGLLNGITNGDMVLRSFGALQISANNTGSPQLTLTNSYVGIGTTNPSENLSVAGGGSVGNISIIPGATYSGYKLALTTQAADEGFNMTMGGTKIMSAYGYNNADEVGLGNLGHENLLYLNANGNVGIGTKSPDTKLTVNGTIHSTEVKVESSVPTPDYVFEPEYKLTTLEDIKAYVDKNHHLPEIPSAKEIEKNGIQIGDMSMKLLKTIEELTLHVIELNNQMKAQNEKITSLENQLKK